ncbi:MAG: hypothetical protein J7M25_02580 [Deltaproteobacteria bacterium]|nr:hypothetical protein [Deltaproteobacteria bacterium]
MHPSPVDCDALLGAVSQVKALLDGVGAWMAEAPRKELAHRGREKFFERTGRVNEDDRSFDARMNAFLEFLVLDWKPADVRGRTLIELFVAEQGQRLSKRDLDLLASASASQRSLFELVDKGKRGAMFGDLLYGGRWRIACSEQVLGVDAGDVIEARIVSIDGSLALLPSIYHHPSEAAVLARTMVEEGLKRKESPRDLSDRLASMLLRHDRYPGMNLRQAYGPAGHGH